MIIPRSKAKLSLLVALGGVAAGIAACTYNWTVGPGPVSGVGDSGLSDAGSDGTAEAGRPGDAGADASNAPTDAGNDAADSASPTPCMTLAQALVAERAPAKACTLGSGECAAPAITDECGCPSYLATASSPASLEYTTSIAEYEEAGCPHPSWCTICLAAGSHGTCLYTDGGGSISCVP
jgi:hypothetical protein